MIALARNIGTVDDLLRRLQLDTAVLAEATGVDSEILEAIAELRYTPSLEQRLKICAVLGVDRCQIIWGHAAVVDHEIRLMS